MMFSIKKSTNKVEIKNKGNGMVNMGNEVEYPNARKFGIKWKEGTYKKYSKYDDINYIYGYYNEVKKTFTAYYFEGCEYINAKYHKSFDAFVHLEDEQFDEEFISYRTQLHKDIENGVRF